MTARVSAALRPSGFWQNAAHPLSRTAIDCCACSALRCDHDTVETASEEIVERGMNLGAGGDRECAAHELFDRIGERCDLGEPALHHSLQAIPANPSEADEAEARAWLRKKVGCAGHAFTTALRKWPERFSSASKARSI